MLAQVALNQNAKITYEYIIEKRGDCFESGSI